MRASAGGVQIGCCVSGHGFGHATRAIAVMQALNERTPACFTIVTSAPSWLFAESLAAPHTVHALETDVGMVQQSPLAENIPATLAVLDRFYPLGRERIRRTAALFADCRLVLCDIAPLGIAAARVAGVPSVLIENFTWDWIYAGYAEQRSQFQPHIDTLAALFARADYRIQTRPVCCPAPCDLCVEPVARRLRHPETIRRRLGCEPGQPLVLLSMGGLAGGEGAAGPAIAPLLQRKDMVFVLTSRSREDRFVDNLRLLAPASSWHHPDLVAAADLVVGKVGYSTVAEAYHGETAFGYVERPGFRESATLEAFLDSRLLSWKIEERSLYNGEWLANVPLLPAVKPPPGRKENGADQAADWVAALLAQDLICRTLK
jgi:hypothetical protein